MDIDCRITMFESWLLGRPRDVIAKVHGISTRTLSRKLPEAVDVVAKAMRVKVETLAEIEKRPTKWLFNVKKYRDRLDKFRRMGA